MQRTYLTPALMRLQNRKINVTHKLLSCVINTFIPKIILSVSDLKAVPRGRKKAIYKNAGEYLPFVYIHTFLYLLSLSTFRKYLLEDRNGPLESHLQTNFVDQNL